MQRRLESARLAGDVVRETREVARSAARITPELLDLILELDDPLIPIAEICRSVGARADRLGLARPSYERIRMIVHRARDRGAPSTASVLLDVAVRARPPEALLDHVSGVGAASQRPASSK